MKTIVRIASVPFCICFLSLHSFANCPVPEIRANGEFFKATLVFTGQVIFQRYVERENESGWYYRIEVKEMFKGNPHGPVTVYSEDSSTRFPLKIGSKYLLFVYRRNARLEIDSCGNSALISEAGESLNKIRSIAESRDGEIEGWIAPETAGINLSGINVTINSRARKYRVTDDDGYFHLRAPTGSYTVDFSNHEYYVNTADLFWYGPRRFTLHPGESATLQFVSIRHRQK